MINKNDTVAIGWCDNGLVDGKFTEGLLGAVLSASPAVKITSSIRVSGNQISRQRQQLLDSWYDNNVSDWLLWVDSDIVLDRQALSYLFSAADSKKIPIISGIYFISKEPEGSVMRPFPCVFFDIGGNEIQHLHPMPEGDVVKCDLAGFGILLMHRSVVKRMRSAFPNEWFFMEEVGSIKDHEFIGEDIVFFRKMKKAGVQLHAHTKATVRHMKRFSLDQNYYGLYWSMEYLKEKIKEDLLSKVDRDSDTR